MLKRIAALALVAGAAASAPAEDPPAPPPKPAEAKIERRLADDVERMAVSNDGKRLAASDRRGGLALFSTETDERRDVVAAAPGDVPHAARFDQLVFTEDGSVLVAVPNDADDGTQVLRFVSVADAKELRTLDVSSKRDPETLRTLGGDSLHQVGAEPGGSKVRLLRQSSVEVWDAATGEKVESRKNDPYAQRSVRSADGALTASGATNEFWVAETASGKERWKVDVDRVVMSGKKVDAMFSGTCHVLGFTADARVLVVFTDVEETKDPSSLNAKNLDKRTKKTTRVEGRLAADGKPAWHHDVPEATSYDDVCAASDTVAVVADGKIEFLDATNGRLREKAPTTAKYCCVAATRDGLTFWAGTEGGAVVKVKTFPPPKAK